MEERTGIKHILPESGLLRVAYLMMRRYLRHGVSARSAALAFYLLFTLFPMMVFFSALLGLLQLEALEILQELSVIVPEEVLEFIRIYLESVGQNPSVRLMLFGLFFSLYFPSRAANALLRAVREAYHLGPPRHFLRHTAKTIACTALLMLTITLTLVLMTAGKWMARQAVERLGLPRLAAVLWLRLRFPVMVLAVFFAVYLLYAMAQDGRRPRRELWPGALGALFGWLAVSTLYSWYVENIASYSLLYGSIGTAIVLLMWLYLTAMTLILGAELNGVLAAMERERRNKEPS